MRGEGSRPAARLPFLVASEEKNQCLRADVQQRVILAAMRWVDADSAVDEHEASAKLLMGRRGYAPGVSSNVVSSEYSRVPDSVVDAAIDRDADCGGNAFSRGVSVTDAVAAGGCRCNSGRWKGSWMPQRFATVPQCAVVCSPCPPDDEDWAHCPHPSTRLCARRLLRVEEGESPLAHR